VAKVPRKLWPFAGAAKNHNRDLKNIFKGVAIRAAAVTGPSWSFYAALVAEGMKRPIARLTLTRKGVGPGASGTGRFSLGASWVFGMSELHPSLGSGEEIKSNRLVLFCTSV
jgi:hypothetical protein